MPFPAFPLQPQAPTYSTGEKNDCQENEVFLAIPDFGPVIFLACDVTRQVHRCPVMGPAWFGVSQSKLCPPFPPARRPHRTRTPAAHSDCCPMLAAQKNGTGLIFVEDKAQRNQYIFYVGTPNILSPRGTMAEIFFPVFWSLFSNGAQCRTYTPAHAD